MRNSIKVCLWLMIVLIVIVLASFSVIRYINKWYPTLGMSDDETIQFYFDFELPADSTVVESYNKDGEFAYKVLLDSNSLNELKLPDNYTEQQYDEFMKTIGKNTKEYIKWWNTNESNARISYERIASSKRDTGKKTALSYIFIVEQDGKTYMYMKHID